MRTPTFWVLLAVTLVGFVARIWRIGVQSLWLDEALSVVFARPGLRQMYTVLVTQDIHPPLYYLVLHFWMLLTGSSEFAVRYVSLLAGAPVVPATYVLGSILFRGTDVDQNQWLGDRGRQVGLIGAILAAISPFLVYYSQEARMYSALATFGVLSTCAFWKLIQAPTRGRLLLYVLFTSAVIYTQYLGGLVLAFQAFYLLGVLVKNWRRAIWGIVGVAAVVLSYLPWLSGAYLQIQRLANIPDFWKGDFQLSFMLTHLFGAFALGRIAAVSELVPAAAVAALLVAGGFVYLATRAIRRGGGELFALTYLLVPLVLLYAVVSRDPKFTERYLIMIAPPFYLVVGLALVSAGRWIASLKLRSMRPVGYFAVSAAGLALVVASISQLGQVYYGPGYRKDDNRAAVAYIEQHAQDGDVAVLMMNTYQSYVFYSRGTVPWLPLQPGGDLAAAAQGLNSVANGHRRIWLLEWNPEWADPTGYVRQSIGQAYRELPVDRQFEGLDLKLYLVDPAYQFAVKTTPSVSQPANFGNKLRLLGYDLPVSRVTAGQTSQIALYWNAVGALSYDYIVSVRVTDGRFYWWRHDDRPAAFNYPTTYWRPDQVVRGVREFQIPAGTPPGTYYLELGVYGQGIGSDLNVLKDGVVAEGTAFRVATIQVDRPAAPPDPEALAIPTRVAVAYANDLRMIGASVLTPRALVGGTVDTTLWWQALRPPGTDYRIQIVLQNGAYQHLVDDSRPVSGKYGTTGWVAREVVVDRHRFVIPVDAPPGPTRVLLQLAVAGSTAPVVGDSGPTFELGTVEVLDRKRLTTAPTDIQYPANWKLGGFAQLIGSTFGTTSGRPGDHIHVTLYWQALGSSGDIGYTVFAHLLDPKNRVKAQVDHSPGDGNDPTSGWAQGEYILDHYDLVIASDALPGTYQLEVGMYDPQTGTRLPVLDRTGQVAGDRILLGTVEVK